MENSDTSRVRAKRRRAARFDLPELSKHVFWVVLVAAAGVVYLPEAWDWTVIGKLAAIGSPVAAFIAGWCVRTLWLRTES